MTRIGVRLLAVAVCLLAAGLCSAQELTIHFIDVGQGDCTLVECPNGDTVLIDCGTSSGGDGALARQ